VLKLYKICLEEGKKRKEEGGGTISGFGESIEILQNQAVQEGRGSGGNPQKNFGRFPCVGRKTACVCGERKKGCGNLGTSA